MVDQDPISILMNYWISIYEPWITDTEGDLTSYAKAIVDYATDLEEISVEAKRQWSLVGLTAAKIVVQSSRPMTLSAKARTYTRRETTAVMNIVIETHTEIIVG